MAIGRKTGGRQKGTPNKKTVARLSAVDKVLSQPPTAPATPKITPRSVPPTAPLAKRHEVEELAEWHEIYLQMKALAAQEQRRIGPDGNPAMDPKVFADHLMNAARILAYSAPYRVAKMPADVNLHHQVDLSQATDEQLVALQALYAAIAANARNGGPGAGETAH
jgi:hypothetical protein